MPNSMKIKAEITFLRPEEGGFSRPHRSGVKPQLKVKDEFTSCVVWADVPDQIFEPSIKYDVHLELLSWEQYKHAIHVTMPVQLNDGRRIVARGIITAIE
jgi:hypothetical protein